MDQGVYRGVGSGVVQDDSSALHLLFTASRGWEHLHYRVFTSLVAQMVKNLPAVQETQVQSLVWEDPQ